jgi:hypothetical protein
MAWRRRGHTTTSRSWIAQGLSMGLETRVTLAVLTVSGTKLGRLGRLRERIAGITRDHS